MTQDHRVTLVEARLGTLVRGKYRLDRVLGIGGMAAVYAATHRNAKRFAVKVLHPDLSEQETVRVRFLREGYLANSVGHPGAVAVLDDDVAEDGSAFLVMELLEGAPLNVLAERWPGARAPLGLALGLGDALLEVLEAAHAKGIVHRDLKPGNLFLRTDGRLAVLDFGIARLSGLTDASHQATQAGTVLGTPAFMAPEQAAGLTSQVSARTDLWAVGATLFTLLSGRLVHDAPTPQLLLVEAATKGAPPLGRMYPELHPAVCEVVDRALAFEPAHRWPDAGAMREAWSRASLEATGRSVSANLAESMEGPGPRGGPQAFASSASGEAGRGATSTHGEVSQTPGEVSQTPGEVLVPARGGTLVEETVASPPRRGALALVAIVGAVLLVAAVTLERRAVQGHAAPAALHLTHLTTGPGTEEGASFSPDGRTLVYSGAGGPVRRIFRRVVQTGQDEALTVSGHDEIQPCVTPDGRAVLFVRARQAGEQLRPGDVFGAYSDGADLFRLDLESREETLLAHDVFSPATSPDGATIAVYAALGGPHRIWLVDANGSNPRQISSAASEVTMHLNPRWSPDGRLLVYQSQEGTKFDVHVIELASHMDVALTDDSASDVYPVFSPSGRFVYFSSDRGGGLNLWRMPIDRTGHPRGPLEQVTTGAGKDVQGALSADGQQLAFTILQQNATLWRLPVSPETGLDAGVPEAVVPDWGQQSRGAYSPDGSQIAFNSDRTGDMNVWVVPTAGGLPRQVTRGPGGDYQPRWSPDSRRLVFFSSRDGRPHLWQVEIASGELVRLTSGNSMEINPSFSADGKWLAFQSDRSGRLEVWVAHADGTQPRQLTSNGVLGHFLAWTAAGDAVIYKCNCVGQPAVMRATLDGAAPVPLGTVKGGSHLSFSPDRGRVMDVIDHRTLWVSPLETQPREVFQFSDPNVRIDYPQWSPDGRWVLFDRFSPEGGDLWVLSGLREDD